jgi:hypothetical protein
VVARWVTASPPPSPLEDIQPTLKEQLLEVTMAVTNNDHYLRQILNKQGHAFCAKGIKVSKKSKRSKPTVTSEPHVYRGDEAEEEMAQLIVKRIKRKTEKQYPPNTVLIISCSCGMYFSKAEWNGIITEVRNKIHMGHNFNEIFIAGPAHCQPATIAGRHLDTRRI